MGRPAPDITGHRDASGIAPSGLARVEVYATLRDAAAAWTVLRSLSAATPYQNFAWIEAWSATIGKARGMTPAIVVGVDATGRPVALLPLGIVRRAGLLVAEFLGGSDSNANLGLFDPRVSWTRTDVTTLLRLASRRTPIDVFALRNQPASWAGQDNPLLLLPHQKSPSATLAVTLSPDPERHFARTVSKHARKAMRQKDRKLAEHGPVTHRRADTRATAQAFLACYWTQRNARFGSLGIAPDPDDTARHAFLQAAWGQGDGASIEVHALACGETVVATFIATGDGDRVSGMGLSFDARPEIARSSPGDLLVAAVVGDLCRRGVRSFDLGIGEARYKETFCDIVEPLFDVFVAASIKGRLAVRLWATAQVGKRRIKQSPRLWPLILRLRKATAGWR